VKGKLSNQNELSAANCSSRENQYDLLRILCMTAVVFIHAVTSKKNQLQQFVLTVSGCAVPVFFMLSGAFTLGNEKILKNLKKYYLNKFYKNVLPTLMFSVLYILWEVFLKVREESFSCAGNFFFLLLKKWISTGIPGNGYHLWFMSVIIFFYAVAPVLLFLKNAYKNIYIYIYITLYIIALGQFYVFEVNFPYYIRWIFYLPVIMTGDFIKEINKKYSNRFLFFIVAVFSVSLLGIEYLMKLELLQNSKNQLVYFLIHDGTRTNIVVDPGTFQIFNLLFSVCIFYLFSKLQIKKNLSKLAEMSFYVYLIHYVLEGIVLALMMKADIKLNLGFCLDSFFGFFIRASLVLFLSCVVAFLILNIKDAFRKSLVKIK